MLFCVGGCAHKNPLSEMRFQTVMAPPFVLSSWYKINAPTEPVKFYIEGAGTPNPENTLMRELAGKDHYANVVYVALPCQYGLEMGCQAPVSVAQTTDAVNQVVRTMMKKARSDKMAFVGYDIGADAAARLSVKYEPNVVRYTSVAGVFEQSPDISFVRVPQKHYVGDKDPSVRLPAITPSDTIVRVKGATHTSGYKSVYKYIQN